MAYVPNEKIDVVGVFKQEVNSTSGAEKERMYVASSCRTITNKGKEASE